MAGMDCALRRLADTIRETTQRLAADRFAPLGYWRDDNLLAIGAGTNLVRRILIIGEIIGLDLPRRQ